MTYTSLQNFDTWLDIFKPKQNTSSTATSPSIIEGLSEKMLGFETYGSDFEHIKSLNPTYVWTLVEEGSRIYIKPGVSLENRLVHLVTEVPWNTVGEIYLYTSEDEID